MKRTVVLLFVAALLAACTPPRGGRIAFNSFRDRNDDIYIINADGTGETRLTDNPTTDFFPAWSPDGRFGFSSNRDGNYEIYVMNAGGSNPVNLTGNPANDNRPAWSPDGKRIVFDSDREGNVEITVMDAGGTGGTLLTANFEIYVMNADGTGQTRLTTNPAHDVDPAWSPDGSHIAFASDRAGNDEI